MITVVLRPIQTPRMSAAAVAIALLAVGAGALLSSRLLVAARSRVRHAPTALTGPLTWIEPRRVVTAPAAGPDLVRLAETLGALVATTITGKGVFPERHPLFLWNGFGDAAPPFVRDAVKDRTVTLAIGCRFSEVGTGSFSCHPMGPLIHADINPEVFDRNEPAAVRLVGDSALTVKALLESLDHAPATRRRDPGPQVGERLLHLLGHVARADNLAVTIERHLPRDIDRRAVPRTADDLAEDRWRLGHGVRVEIAELSARMQ